MGRLGRNKFFFGLQKHSQFMIECLSEIPRLRVQLFFQDETKVDSVRRMIMRMIGNKLLRCTDQFAFELVNRSSISFAWKGADMICGLRPDLVFVDTQPEGSW
jgi:hypothetical protein